jgi:hypothetical protein
MVFARPVSRLRLLLVKYAAISIYTFSFVFFVGITGYLMAVAATIVKLSILLAAWRMGSCWNSTSRSRRLRRLTRCSTG